MWTISVSETIPKVKKYFVKIVSVISYKVWFSKMIFRQPPESEHPIH